MFPKVLAGTLATLGVAGALAFSEGAVVVTVVKRGPSGKQLWLFAPGALAPVGLRLVPAEMLRHVSGEMRAWLPAIQAASEELARCPDASLVEMRSPTEQVSIVKRGGAIVVDLNSPSETVHISVPLPTLARVARMLAERGPAS